MFRFINFLTIYLITNYIYILKAKCINQENFCGKRRPDSDISIDYSLFNCIIQTKFYLNHFKADA